ncbi:MAG: hypothetical protein ABI675_19570 [Chitinophagaceae bacterium]
MISKENLQTIADLQIKICTIDGRLGFLRDCIKQICYDNCSISLSFRMTNRDIQQKNEAELKASGYFDAERLANIYGIPVQLMGIQKPAQTDPCPQFLASFTEANAILVLNVFYEQELALQKKYQAQLQDLLSRLSPAVENPILNLPSS